jgi:hypothetical protein
VSLATMPGITIGAPDDLAERDQWLLWRYERDTKVPYQVNGRRASSTDPRTWNSYAAVQAALWAHPDRYDGAGFVFWEEDPFAGIDADDCLDDAGNVKPWAQGILMRFSDSYCEISPSGHGVKIWARGSLPSNLGKVLVGDGGLEMYSHSRFFTVTGRAFRGAPPHVEDHATDLLLLHEGLTAGRRGWAHQPQHDGRIPHGQQHFTLVSLAGTLRRRRVCPEAILACLLEVNQRQCEKPGPPENIGRIIRSTRGWE